MKKITKRIGLLLLALTFICCSVTVSGTESNAVTLKQKYTSRYKKLVKKCKKKFNYDNAGSMYEMRTMASKEFGVWDKELNYVYKDIYKRLSAAKKKTLKQSEIKWIKKKEKKAEQYAYEEGGGFGSNYSLLYLDYSTKLTKKRILWLIKNYT